MRSHRRYHGFAIYDLKSGGCIVAIGDSDQSGYFKARFFDSMQDAQIAIMDMPPSADDQRIPLQASQIDSPVPASNDAKVAP